MVTVEKPIVLYLCCHWIWLTILRTLSQSIPIRWLSLSSLWGRQIKYQVWLGLQVERRLCWVAGKTVWPHKTCEFQLCWDNCGQNAHECDSTQHALTLTFAVTLKPCPKCLCSDFNHNFVKCQPFFKFPAQNAEFQTEFTAVYVVLHQTQITLRPKMLQNKLTYIDCSVCSLCIVAERCKQDEPTVFIELGWNAELIFQLV